MTQPSISDAANEPASTSPGGGSRAMATAREIRERMLREKRRRRLLFAAVIIGAIIAAVGWAMLVERPRYSAESRFEVRGSSAEQAQSGAATSLLSGGSGGSAGIGFVDGFAVNDFLKSRDCMLQLSRQLPLARMLKVGPNAGTETLFDAYRNAVKPSFLMVEQENVIAVHAYSPGDSQAIATALIKLAQQFVAKLDGLGIANALSVDAHQLEIAQGQAVSAGNAVAAWRASNHDVDPAAGAAMVLNLISQLEQELNTARINYEKVRAFDNPDHPMLGPAQMQVAGLERQLASARGRLAGGGDSQAAKLRTYSQLQNAQTFADSNLTAARNAYQQAYSNTIRLRRYLSPISEPIATDVPSSPNLWLRALEGLLAGILLAFLTSLGLSMLPEGRDSGSGPAGATAAVRRGESG